MGTINWVHISDLHFGCEEDVSVWGFRTQATAYLCKYFESVGHTPEYLFVTGDIVFPKNNPDISASYDEALAFIEEMAKKLSIRRENILAVPGNHDVTRNGVRFKAANELLAKGNYNFARGKPSPELDTIWDKLTPSEEFMEFYTKLCGKDFSGNHCLIPRDFIDILCLDTSLVAIDSRKDNGKLIVGSYNVLNRLKASPAGKPVLVLAHHPLSAMNSIERAKLTTIFEENGVFAYLYGHSHFLGLELPSVLGNPDMPSRIDAICCPTHMNEEDDDGPATILGLLTGTYDTTEKEGVATYHIWPTSFDETVPRKIEVRLCPKSKKAIDELQKTNEKISKIIQTNTERAPQLLAKYITDLFEECLRKIYEIEAARLRSMREEVLVQKLNVPIGDTSGGTINSNDELVQKNGVSEDIHSEELEKTLTNIKSREYER